MGHPPTKPQPKIVSLDGYIFFKTLKILLLLNFIVGSSVYTEQLFKNTNKGESFLDQQFWLYAYGAMVASTYHFISNPTYTIPILIEDLKNTDSTILMILVIAVLFASLGGIVVASILKYLDNIVKEYTGSVANILTAVLSR